MPFQLFTLAAAAGCPQCPSPRWSQPCWSDVSSPPPLTLSCAHAPCWCASSTTYWACPWGLTPIKDQWFQLVPLYLVGVLHLQPTEPVLEVWLLSKTSGYSLCPHTALVWFIYNLLSLSFGSDSSQRPVVPACWPFICIDPACWPYSCSDTDALLVSSTCNLNMVSNRFQKESLKNVF